MKHSNQTILFLIFVSLFTFVASDKVQATQIKVIQIQNLVDAQDPVEEMDQPRVRKRSQDERYEDDRDKEYYDDRDDRRSSRRDTEDYDDRDEEYYEEYYDEGGSDNSTLYWILGAVVGIPAACCVLGGTSYCLFTICCSSTSTFASSFSAIGAFSIISSAGLLSFASYDAVQNQKITDTTLYTGLAGGALLLTAAALTAGGAYLFMQEEGEEEIQENKKEIPLLLNKNSKFETLLSSF